MPWGNPNTTEWWQSGSSEKRKEERGDVSKEHEFDGTWVWGERRDIQGQGKGCFLTTHGLQMWVLFFILQRFKTCGRCPITWMAFNILSAKEYYAVQKSTYCVILCIGSSRTWKLICGGKKSNQWLSWVGRDRIWLGRGTKQLSAVMEMLYTLTGIWVIQVYMFVKMHQMAHSRFVHFLVCKICLNDKNKILWTNT